MSYKNLNARPLARVRHILLHSIPEDKELWSRTPLHTMFWPLVIGILFQNIPWVYPLPLFFGGADLAPLPSSDIVACTQQRTIWDIIWSCIVTIFACSWVSVHPNMPKPREHWFKICMHRTEVLFWALVAPELILYWAARQWYGAKKLTRRYKGKPS